MASRSACSRAGPRPMRASRTRRGTLPLRKPGSLTSRAIVLNACVDVLVELGLVDLDVDLDFVPLEGFNRRFHRPKTLPSRVGGAARRRATVRADRRPVNVHPVRTIRQNGAVQFWKPHALAKPHEGQIDLKIGDKVRAIADCRSDGVARGHRGQGHPAPTASTGMRYRVLFDNGGELGDLDHRHLEPIGRTAKRLAKRAKAAARGLTTRTGADGRRRTARRRGRRRCLPASSRSRRDTAGSARSRADDLSGTPEAARRRARRRPARSSGRSLRSMMSRVARQPR